MNILFMHEVDWLSKVVFDIHSLAESLSLLGHRVFAIDYENTWRKKSFLDFGTLRTKEVKGVSRAYSGSSVTLRRPGFIKVPGVSRASAALTHYREIGRTIKKNDIDAIVLYSVPTNGLQTLRQAKKSNIPVLFRAIDILNQLVPVPALRPATRLLEKRVYSNVDMILSLTPKLSDYAVNLGAKESKIRLLPFPVDTNLFHPGVDCSEVRKKWADGPGPVILYIGTLFDFSGLDGFISLFPRIQQEVPDARLLIVGDGPQRPKLDKLIASLSLKSKVTITGFQPYDTMPRYINMSTVCLLPFLEVDATRDIFPGKVAQYLACGRVVMSTPLPGMLPLVHGEGQGVVYVNNPDETVREMVSLLKSEERRKKLEAAALIYAREMHGHESIAKKLEAFIQEAVRKKSTA